MSIWRQVFGSIWGGWRTQGVSLGGADGAFAGEAEGEYDSVTAESALRLSAVWACVALRGSTIASLPLHLRDDDKAFAKNHPLYRILHDSPNADMTASEYWEMQSVGLDLDGNSFSKIERNTRGDVTALIPWASSAVEVRRRENGAIVYKYGDRDYADSDVLHLKGFTRDGIVGMSALEYARSTFGGQLEANTAAARFFRQGLKNGGFLKSGVGTLTPEQRVMLRNSLAEFGKAKNAGKWMVLEAGMEPIGADSMRVKPADAELLMSRYFGIEEICRVFRVPPQLIGHTDKASSWASSLENTNLGFLTYSLRPTLVRIEQAISKKLLRPDERGTYSPKFSVEGLLRADSASRSAFYTSSLQNGWRNRNEVRALEDLPPIDGGDTYTVQLNMAPIDQLGSGGAAAAIPPPAAKDAQPINIEVNVAERKTAGFTITRDPETGTATAKPMEST